MENTVIQIAKAYGREHITPEDVAEAMRAHRDDPHRVRIDVLEVLGKAGRRGAFGVAEPKACALAAYDGPEPFIGPLQIICRYGDIGNYGKPCQGHIERGCKSARDCCHNYFF